ncbi:MAG: lysophospholipid acyltransferase family protein [Desulfobulbaceae bacterium]|nr:lysophospholipid acyltransferase family protein [Desulfobulbaceae bacterium]HIJ78072.1 lysophospholipid acyltransferase family protein [Deltaproteobacteria bacterium]
MAIKDGWRYRLTLAIAPYIYRIVSRLLFATCRVEDHGGANMAGLEKGGRPFIAAFWHYSIFYVVHRSRGKRWVAMVSASKDGEYISRILQGMGYETVRGSKGKGGLGALRGMVAAVRNKGLNAAIVADGSQGPAREVQAGVILLAAKTGAPILPVAWAADRYLVFRSWDRTVLPKPFAKIKMYYGAPLRVPEKLSAEELEAQRLLLEQRLNELYAKAWQGFGSAGHACD